MNYANLSAFEKLKTHLAFAAMRLSGWRHINSAPRDGTTILVLECPNGEAWNVMAARWMTIYFSRDFDEPKPDPMWWGASWRAGYSEWEGGPWGHAYDVAISPQWWKPMPRKPLTNMIRYWASWQHYERKIK
jgi:hypothetical protein